MKLNLGCGYNKRDGYVNVDMSRRCNPDIVMNLEHMDSWWQFADDSVDDICADNILEHLAPNPMDFVAIIKQMYRISKDGAEWYVSVPHHRCDNQFDDFTHVRILTPKTFKMFDQNVNVASIENGLSDSVYGLDFGIDLEVVEVQYDLIGHWKEQLDEGHIGWRELEMKMNTLSNVAQSVNMWIKVHKPERQKHWVPKYK